MNKIHVINFSEVPISPEERGLIEEATRSSDLNEVMLKLDCSNFKTLMISSIHHIKTMARDRQKCVIVPPDNGIAAVTVTISVLDTPPQENFYLLSRTQMVEVIHLQ